MPRCGIERAAVREQAFLQAGDEDDRELQALGVVHGQQRDGGAARRVESASETRAAWSRNSRSDFAALAGFGGGVQEFVQVRQAGDSESGPVSSWSMLAVAGAVEDVAESVGDGVLLGDGRRDRRSCCGKPRARLRRGRGERAPPACCADGFPEAECGVRRRSAPSARRWSGRCRAPAC